MYNSILLPRSTEAALGGYLSQCTDFHSSDDADAAVVDLSSELGAVAVANPMEKSTMAVELIDEPADQQLVGSDCSDQNVKNGVRLC